MITKPYLTLFFTFFLAFNGIGQNGTKFSLTGNVGYFMPMGEWTEHRYASNVNQFAGSYTVSPELEIKFSDVAIGFIYSYARMNTTEWEDYVNSQGESLNASASMSHVGGFVRYYIYNSMRNFIHIEAGATYLFISSNEQFNGYTYEYDFLKPGMAFLAGAGYQYAFNERLTIVLPVQLLWRPEGVKYGEGKTLDIFGIYFTPGLKLSF
jgi:hypothetical protein